MKKITDFKTLKEGDWICSQSRFTYVTPENTLASERGIWRIEHQKEGAIALKCFIEYNGRCVVEKKELPSKQDELFLLTQEETKDITRKLILNNLK